MVQQVYRTLILENNMETKWFVANKKADFQSIAEQFHISPVLARIIRNRDITQTEQIAYFLQGTLSDLHDCSLLPDVEKGCAVILQSIERHDKIRIIGDYDVDGICSTHILKDAIVRAGGVVSCAIPHRMKDGYGLSDQLVMEAKDAGVQTIITCDNGIAAYDQIALANELGMRVVVTDHHEVPYTENNGETVEILPPAEAVVDPKCHKSEYPYAGICGAFVAYKFGEMLLRGKSGVSTEQIQDYLDDNLPFAAIATICDVMELLDENRIVVKYGLKAVSQTRNTGLRALLSVLELTETKLDPYHIGFIIGPCINATGRLDSARRALELFGTDDEREAVLLATQLRQMNEERKEMTRKFTEKAIQMIECRQIPQVIVLYLPDCHESLAGIIAGNIRERYERPAIVITKAEEGVKGSARSIEAYNMYEELHKVEELFTKYGGHPMAAGLSMASESDVPVLRERLNANATLKESDFIHKVLIDVPMPISYVSPAIIDEIEKLEPYGTGNPKPVFAQKNVRLSNGRVLGKNRNVASFRLTDGEGHFFDAIYFGEADEMVAQIEAHQGICDIVYYPSFHEYRGNKTIQIVIKYYGFRS